MSISEHAAGGVPVLTRRPERRRKVPKRAEWTAPSRHVHWHGGSAEAFPYEASIRVDNPFVASGVVGRGFRKVPVYTHGFDLRGWPNETASFNFGKELDLGWANDVALLDESNKVLLVSNSAREWDYQVLWEYALGSFRSTQEVELVVSNPPYKSAVYEQPHALPIAHWRLLGAGAIPAGVTVAGCLLLVGGSVTDPIRPNPYIGLFLLLAGIGLAVTAMLALRDVTRRP